MLARILVVVGALAALLGPAGAPARSAQDDAGGGTIGVRLLEAPVDRRDDPRARRYIVDHVSPGTKVTRRFEVTNTTDGELDVDLYAAAATLRDGDFVPAEGRTPNDLTSWTTVTPAEARIPANGRVEATVTIAVPADAAAGERYAAVLAEAPPSPGAGVSVVSRVGIRVYLSVGPGGEPPTDFELVTFSPKLGDDGTPAVDIETCNSGERAIDVTGELDLTEGPGGTRAGPFTTTGATTVAPDACATVTVPLDGRLPRGPWKAKVTLRSGPAERTAEATVTFPEQAGESAPPVEPKEVTGTGGGRLALLLALLLLLLALALLAWSLWRRRQKRGEDRSGGAAVAER